MRYAPKSMRYATISIDRRRAANEGKRTMPQLTDHAEPLPAVPANSAPRAILIPEEVSSGSIGTVIYSCPPCTAFLFDLAVSSFLLFLQAHHQAPCTLPRQTLPLLRYVPRHSSADNSSVTYLIHSRCLGAYTSIKHTHFVISPPHVRPHPTNAPLNSPPRRRTVLPIKQNNACHAQQHIHQRVCTGAPPAESLL